MTSAKTSRNQIAAGFKKVKWVAGTINLDIGGGKYQKATDWLKEEHGVFNIIYDPYNRTDKHNNAALAAGKVAKTATLFNVLNVIPKKRARIAAMGILLSLPSIETIYITVYEGDGSGIGRITGEDTWQENRKLRSYLAEVQVVFQDADILVKNGMITILRDAQQYMLTCTFKDVDGEYEFRGTELEVREKLDYVQAANMLDDYDIEEISNV